MYFVYELHNKYKMLLRIDFQHLSCCRIADIRRYVAVAMLSVHSAKSFPQQQVEHWNQWRKSGWNSWGRRCGSGRLDEAWRREVGWCGISGRVWGGLGPLPRKMHFHLKFRVLVHSERYFYSMSWPEKCWVSAWSRDMVNVEDVLFGSSEFSIRVMGLVSLLLHCNACNSSNLVLEILKHDKIWGTICISVPHSKLWEFVPLVPPVLYTPMTRTYESLLLLLLLPVWLQARYRTDAVTVRRFDLRVLLLLSSRQVQNIWCLCGGTES